uniref:hypothetical protein n=1 Tax=Rhodoblastus sp. TaxID=1962975 RepID=UPI003F9D48FC
PSSPGARRLIRTGRLELQFLPGRSDEKTAKLRLPRPQGGGGGAGDAEDERGRREGQDQHGHHKTAQLRSARL